jgi:DNA-binding transcriptional LysR family regulator
MNLRSLDLNLLVILSVLLEEAHVTRAAKRLGLSQPATSSALDRCRAVFGDVLLERGSRGMRLTPRAETLKQPLAAILAEVGELVQDRPTDVSAMVQTVDVTMADMPGVAIVSQVFAGLARTAPGIKLSVRPWRGADEALDALQRGATDLAVSVFMNLKEPFHGRQMSRETFSVVARDGHPALATLNLDTWLSYPHVLVSGSGNRSSPIDDSLAALGRTRTIGIVVPTFLMVPPLLRDSDLIALLPTRAIAASAPEGLTIRPPPIPIDDFPLHVAWHRRRDHDLAVQHVAAVIEQAINGVE